jgi:hypothetical protein
MLKTEHACMLRVQTLRTSVTPTAGSLAPLLTVRGRRAGYQLRKQIARLHRALPNGTQAHVQAHPRRGVALRRCPQHHSRSEAAYAGAAPLPSPAAMNAKASTGSMIRPARPEDNSTASPPVDGCEAHGVGVLTRAWARCKLPVDQRPGSHHDHQRTRRPSQDRGLRELCLLP